MIHDPEISVVDIVCSHDSCDMCIGYKEYGTSLCESDPWTTSCHDCDDFFCSEHLNRYDGVDLCHECYINAIESERCDIEFDIEQARKKMFVVNPNNNSPKHKFSLAFESQLLRSVA